MDAPQMEKMLKYAVIGWPVAHSKSPVMQNAGFRALNIPAQYGLVEVPPGKLQEKVQWMLQQGYSGWNVTVPYKEEMAAMVEVVGEEARAAGSVNTVVNQNGRLLGYSTDGYGVAMAIKCQLGLEQQPENQLFVGCGGAAKAVAVYAARHGAKKIWLANRTLAKAQEIAQLVQAAAPQCAVKVMALEDHKAISQALQAAQILYQCTSLGLHPDDPEPIPAEIVPPTIPVYDFVYTPSLFQKKLQAQGNVVAAGWEMLLWQGCRSLEIWTGQPAPVAAMRQALGL